MSCEEKGEMGREEKRRKLRERGKIEKKDESQEQQMICSYKSSYYLHNCVQISKSSIFYKTDSDIMTSGC